MAWQWSESIHRYRDKVTGRFASRDDVLSWVNESIAGSDTAVYDYSLLVDRDNPTISPTDWQEAMRKELKGEYIRQYVLGRGGVDQMTQVDWGSVGGMLAEQYKYLQVMAEQLEAGELTQAQVAARSQMYIRSSREAFERANRRGMEELGMSEVQWVINPSVENCPDCEAFAAMGWIPVTDNPYGGCFPGSGCTQCVTNCACHLEYR